MYVGVCIEINTFYVCLCICILVKSKKGINIYVSEKEDVYKQANKTLCYIFYRKKIDFELNGAIN